MQFIHSTNPNEGLLHMASQISVAMNSGKPVLWLVCGGSNISGAVEALYSIHAGTTADSRKLLSVAQTDERYGPVGHHDSNWHQMKVAGFDFNMVRALPVLTGKNLEETVQDYSWTIDAEVSSIKAMTDMPVSYGGLIVALFGIGPDGHIAGILPHSPAVRSSEPVAGYDAGKFTRVTLTPPILRKIDLAYAFAFGGSKREAIDNLRNKQLSIDEQPAVILKELEQAFVYSDQM